MGRLLLVSLIAVAAASVRAEGSSESLVLDSASYAGFRQLLTGAAPDARTKVPATLAFPAAMGRVPAVIVVHTLAGYREDNEGWQARALREAGFATLTYDSFASRNLGDLVARPSPRPPPYPSALADAFAALAVLARHPRIDGERVAILGFSFGGEVAHATAFARFRALLGAGAGRFAAHVAFYPAGVYGVVAGPDAYTGAPILMMIGGDDTLPRAKAEAYLAYEKAAGYPAPIELVIYPEARHGWTAPGLGAARDYPYLASTRKCPFALFGAHGGPQLLVEGALRPFDDGAFAACIRANLGYAMGFDEETRTRSTAAAIVFLKRHLAR